MTYYCEHLTGEVSDILTYDEVEDYVVPDAALYNWHPGQELVLLDPEPSVEFWTYKLPLPLRVAVQIVLFPFRAMLPEFIVGPEMPILLVPADSVEVGEEIEVRATRVVDPTAAGADRAAPVYRAASVGGVSL
jgi:hypothetical protein